jgi:tetratricopeptide (TPR) repeat protein
LHQAGACTKRGLAPSGGFFLFPPFILSPYLCFVLKNKSKTPKSSPSLLDWLLPFGLILLATYLVYAPSFQFGFTNWDDPTYVKDNPLIRDFSAQGFQKLFTVFLSGNYHPFVLVSYWLEMKWGGGDPAVFHKVNWLLHSLNAILVWAILRVFFKSPYAALAGALLFAVHPLHVESVAWVTERKDVLYGFFLLLSVFVYLKYSEDRPALGIGLALLLFVFSGLSKGQAVALVPALVVLDYLRGKKVLDTAYILRILPFVIIALGIGILAIYAQQNQANVRIQNGYGAFEQILIGFQGLWFYLSRTLAPVGLSAFYTYPDISGGIPSGLMLNALGGIVFLGILGYTFKKSPSVFAGLILFFLTIFPVLQFLPVGNAAMADRYYYIPALGLCMVLAYGVEYYQHQSISKPLLALTLAYLLSMTYLARNRVMIWKDSFTLWENVLENYPDAAIAWNSLANAWYEKNEYGKAAEYFEKAISFDATDPKSFNNLGNCYDRTGRPELAVVQFKKALDIRPGDPMVYTNLGVAYDRMGKADSAIEAHRQSVQIAPTPLGYANLANVLEKAGQLEASVEACKSAIALDPNYALAYNNLGVALYRMGKIEEAIEALKSAARLGYGPAKDYLSPNGIAW